MNLPQWLSHGRNHEREISLRVSNVTRDVELASRIEIANTSSKRRKGLLGRDALAAGEGLWIVPCESVHTFGMRFPIDLIYLDREKRVKKVRHSVPPQRLSACLSAHSVIELASGVARRTGTQPGDKLNLEQSRQDKD
jgi:uncharacterized membrane protein (UPF0127 family)